MMNMPWRIVCTPSFMLGCLSCRAFRAGPASASGIRGSAFRWVGAKELSAVSRKDFAEGLTAMSDGHGPAAVVEHGHVRIDAQAMVDGGAHVADVRRPVLDVGRVGIGS